MAFILWRLTLIISAGSAAKFVQLCIQGALCEFLLRAPAGSRTIPAHLSLGDHEVFTSLEKYCEQPLF